MKDNHHYKTTIFRDTTFILDLSYYFSFLGKSNILKM